MRRGRKRFCCSDLDKSRDVAAARRRLQHPGLRVVEHRAALELGHGQLPGALVADPGKRVAALELQQFVERTRVRPTDLRSHAYAARFFHVFNDFLRSVAKTPDQVYDMLNRGFALSIA